MDIVAYAPSSLPRQSYLSHDSVKQQSLATPCRGSKKEDVVGVNKYVIGKVIHHTGQASDTKCFVRSYGYNVEHDKLEPAEHIHEHFITQHRWQQKQNKKN